ncbi:hypothetical protein JNW98_35165, partial [Streptomyces sp. SCA2-4]|nr:hypothetical protein [Streptomyces huiliensis]
RGQQPPQSPRPPANPSRAGGLTQSGLPTRVPGSTPGAGAPTGGPSLFDASPPAGAGDDASAKGADGRSGLPSRGKRPAVIAPVGKDRRPQQPPQRGEGTGNGLPVRGGAGDKGETGKQGLPKRDRKSTPGGLPVRGEATPSALPELPQRGGAGTGLPQRGGNEGGLPRRAGDESGLPQRGAAGNAGLPPRNALSGLPKRGDRKNTPAEPPARPAPSWGNDRSPAAPVDDWPLSSNGSSRAAQDTPRGHDSVEAPERAEGPSATGQFPQLAPVPEPESSSTGRHALPAAPGDTGSFARPETRPETRPQTDGPGSTGQFPRLAPVPEPESSSTGRHALPSRDAAAPADPSATAAFPQLAPVPDA